MTDSEIHSVEEALGIADNTIIRLRAGLEKAKISHDRCEDEWYSCPKTGECARDYPGEECDCGADQHNKAIDEILEGGK